MENLANDFLRMAVACKSPLTPWPKSFGDINVILPLLMKADPELTVYQFVVGKKKSNVVNWSSLNFRVKCRRLNVSPLDKSSQECVVFEKAHREMCIIMCQAILAGIGYEYSANYFRPEFCEQTWEIVRNMNGQSFI